MNDKIVVSGEDAWRIYELFEEMNDFLHQPAHYARIEDFHEWLERKKLYPELHDVFYAIVATWFPPDAATGEVHPPPGVMRRLGT